MSEGLYGLLADAELPADVRPQSPGTHGLPGSLLVTGATGFLGRYVIVELLKHTSSLLVLVARQKSGISAELRTQSILLECGVAREDIANRIRIIDGDVTQQCFGLTSSVYDKLSKEVTGIYHFAAAVDWVRDYNRLRKSNVESVRRIIDFACHDRTKRIVFASSIAVCMVNGGPERVYEDTPVLPLVAGMPLGYSRSKAVAETLLRECAGRGVPVTIVRPPLITGHSTTGHSNPSDIVSALLQACIRTGLAPDTDWTFDIVPVDYVARVLTQVEQGEDLCQTFNLKHGKAQSWRSLVTWMNLHGYPVRSIPTDDWISLLFNQGEARGSMLYTQRQYFSGRPARAGEDGWVQPFRTYLANCYARVDAAWSNDRLNILNISPPKVDIELLHSYFKDLRRAGVLPNLPDISRSDIRPDVLLSEGWVYSDDAYNEAGIHPAVARPVGLESGIMNRLAACRVKDSAGVWAITWPGRTETASLTGVAVLKIKSHGRVLQDQSAALASVNSPELGDLFRRYGDPFDLADSHSRELAIYEMANSRLSKFMPTCYGTLRSEKFERWALLLEHLPQAEEHGPSDWIGADGPAMDQVIDGLAGIHSIWYERHENLDVGLRPGRTPTLQSMIDRLPLWQELANFVNEDFAKWGGAGLAETHRETIRLLPDWWPRYEALPRTLIHNDLNPRNFVLRAGAKGEDLCVYDWELAAVGPPQRDLAEVLCFTWRDTMGAEQLERLLERSRLALNALTGKWIDPKTWREGFALALRYLLISRLPLYTLIFHLAPLQTLPDVVLNWTTLFELTNLIQV